MGAGFSLCNLCVSGLTLLAVYQFIYRQELPRKILFAVRLALHMQIVPQKQVYGIILTVLILGYLCIFAAEQYVRRDEKKETDMKQKKGNRGGKIVIAAVFAAAVLAYFFVPSVHSAYNNIARMFSSGDFTVVREFMESYGAWAAAVSFALMIFQSIAAPLPAFLLTFANANLFGWWQGAILSWSSAMAGAAVCFYIARILGRDVVEKFTSRAGLKQIDDFFERHGRLSILIARLLPFISFDIVSYAAGLTSVSFGSFFIATGVGQLPATIVYSYVGGMLTGGARMFVTALLILFALSALIILLRQIYMERQKNKGIENTDN